MPQIDNHSLFNQPPRPLALVVKQPAAGTTEYVTDAGQTVDPVPVYFPAGIPAKAAIAALTPVSTADATDLPTAIALTNANKAKINAIIAALKA